MSLSVEGSNLHILFIKRSCCRQNLIFKVKRAPLIKTLKRVLFYLIFLSGFLSEKFREIYLLFSRGNLAASRYNRPNLEEEKTSYSFRFFNIADPIQIRI